MKYKKTLKSPKISLKFFNSDTNDLLFELDGYTHLNLDMSDHCINELINEWNSSGKKKLPPNIMVMAVSNLSLVN